MINSVVYNVSLDIYKIGSQKVLSMVRGDTKRTIVISLTENERPYLITEGCTAFFTALKPDGNYIYNECSIDYTNNTIVYDVTAQTTAVNGKVDCQLRLVGKEGNIISSPTFSVVVADLLYNEQPIVDSSNEFNALTSYIAKFEARVSNGEFNGKSIYIKGSVNTAEDLIDKLPTAEAGDGYLTNDCHLHVFDGTSFVDVGLVRGERGFSGVYVGSGDMPDGYNVQIDPNGDVFAMDTKLDAESKNPVENRVIAVNVEALNDRILTLEEKTKFFDGVDDKLDETSKNPVENRVICLEIGMLKNRVEGIQEDIQFVYEQLSNKPEQNTLLWSGNVSVGNSITIVDFAKYKLFAFKIKVYDEIEKEDTLLKYICGEGRNGITISESIGFGKVADVIFTCVYNGGDYENERTLTFTTMRITGENYNAGCTVTEIWGVM